jgi:gas vesicle protein
MATSGDENGAGRNSGDGRSEVAKHEAAELTGTAKEQGAAVGGTAQAGGQRVVAEAANQVGQLSEQVQNQLSELLERSQEEFTGRASEQTDKAATQLRGVAGELRALADGRPEDAPRARDYVGQAAERVEAYAGRLDRDGFAGVANDLGRFARRRPGTFLLGAAAAGFVAGRLARGAQTATGSDESTTPGLPDGLSPSPAPGRDFRLDPPPPAASPRPGEDPTGPLPAVLPPAYMAGGSVPPGER